MTEFLTRERHCVLNDYVYPDTLERVTPGTAVWNREMMWGRDPATVERFHNVLDLRTAKVKDWLELRDVVKNYHLVRYEDAVADPAGLLRCIAVTEGLAPKCLRDHIVMQKGSARLKQEDALTIGNGVSLHIERAVG